MKCLLRYEWVKLLRACLPEGKGILGHWAKLASRAAFRKGQARYCGHTNHVNPGMWSGGVVGLKSILGVKSRAEALKIMDTLQELGYITYTLDMATKKLEYVMLDWVLQCCGTECMEGSVYATEGYGFLCYPAVFRSVWQIISSSLARRTHGWICGVIRYGRMTITCSLFRHRRFNSGLMVPL